MEFKSNVIKLSEDDKTIQEEHFNQEVILQKPHVQQKDTHFVDCGGIKQESLESTKPDKSPGLGTGIHIKEECWWCDGTSAGEKVAGPTVQRQHEITPQTWSTKRKSDRREGMWKRNDPKQRLHLGLQYKTQKKGTIQAARKLGSPCNCPMKCWDKVKAEACSIYTNFWDLGDRTAQDTYLMQSMKKMPKKRQYTKGEKSRRAMSYIYTVKVEGCETEICKVMFTSLHGFHSSSSRIKRLQGHLKEGLTTPELDCRGKHLNRPNKYPEEAVQACKEFLDSLPKYRSHYSHNHNPHKVYLACDMTVNGLYHDYYAWWCQDKGKTKLSTDKFRRIFCEQYNISFKLPKSDTCPTCDKLEVDIAAEREKENSADLLHLTTEKDLHHYKAAAAQSKIKYMGTLASDDPNNFHVIAIHLQQALPTPKLTVNHAFYRRKLWTYNVGIYDCATGIGYMFLWSEENAKRGSEEIASCILKYLEIRNITKCNELHIISDNCKVQNKNWTLISMYSALVTSGSIENIYHHFPLVGHTHLPCDRDFGCIEQYVQNLKQPVYTPMEWVGCITKANRTKKTYVTMMDITDFKDFSPLTTVINKKTKTDVGEPLNFSDASVFHISRKQPQVLNVAYTYNLLQNVIYTSTNFQKSGEVANAVNLLALNPKNNETLEICKKKYDDIISLLPWVPSVHHSYYMGLKCTSNIEDDNIETLT